MFGSNSSDQGQSDQKTMQGSKSTLVTSDGTLSEQPLPAVEPEESVQNKSYVECKYTDAKRQLRIQRVSNYGNESNWFWTVCKGPRCPSGYDAGLTNKTSLVRFPSPLNFS